MNSHDDVRSTSRGACVDARWMARGACGDVDPDMFFPDRDDKAAIRSAIAVCVSCPVLRECAGWRRDHPSCYGYRVSGVWAGRYFPATPIRGKERS
jgi:ferredoxin